MWTTALSFKPLSSSLNIPGHFLYTPGIFGWGTGFLFPVDFWFCPGAIPDRIRAQFYNLVWGGGVRVYCDNDLKYFILVH